MRKSLAVAAVALTSMFFTGSAFAQGTTPPTEGTPAPGAPTDASTNEADKKIGVGGELLFLLPLGDLGDATGPQVGPVLRFGYRVTPPLELTARIGYLIGLKTERDLGIAKVETGLNLIPIWAGARYFFMEPYAGLYGAAELGLNILSPTVSGGGNAGDSLTRIGFNGGIGYVISKDLPIDIRAQFTMYNLLLKEDVGNVSEPTYIGLGLSAGYTFQF